MTVVLPTLVETTPTRLALHRLAEDVLAAEQKAAIGTIRLQVMPNGFTTRWFPGAGGAQLRLRVDGGELVRETDSGAVREPIAGDFDAVAASVLYAWYDLGAQALEAIKRERGALASDIVLWPEHFDLGVTIDVGASVNMNLGFSPGDDFCAQPYVYAGPHDLPPGPFWNAPFGAYRTYDQIRSAGADEAAAAFLQEALTELSA